MSNEDAEGQIKNLYDIVREAVEGWINRNCLEEQLLKQKITKLLDRKLNEIVCKIFGFDNDFGGWKVDHCNGRTEHSVVGNYLKSKTTSIVNEWIDKQVGDLSKVTIPPDAVESLRKDITSAFKREVDYKIRDLARNKAEEFINNILSQIVLDENQIKEAIKALEFISVFSTVAVEEKKADK